jgi:hypothetical protein
VKAGVVFTGSGPILVLTTFASFSQGEFAEKLANKGIHKFIAYELPLELVKERYGSHYQAVMHDVRQTDDLRVLDYNGYHIFHNFSFSELGEPIFFET